MSIYKISALIGNRTRTLQVAAWNDEDAMHRAERRLISEGIPLFTLSILERKTLATMKHLFSDAQIIEASQKAGTVAGLQYATLSIDYLHAFADALPDPATDEWQECTIDQIREGDRFKVEGRGWHYESTEIHVFVDVVCVNPRTGSFITRDEVDQIDEITLYRIPAPVQHPDPAEHPVIIDEAGRPWFSAGLDEYHSPHHHSIFRNPRDFETWTPAKVVSDDE